MRRHPFDELLELDTVDIRLDCAALHLARDEYPDIDVLSTLNRLDDLATDVAAKRPGISLPNRFQALRAVLVEDFGLRGNEDYYDPDNSYLNRVLERRVGIPITNSIIWMEVARRLNWPAEGIGFPGRFLVRMEDAEYYVLIDPFQEGRTLSLSDCAELLSQQSENKVKLTAEHLEPADTRAILIRMLNNLRGIYLAQSNWSALARVLERLSAAEPENPRHVTELAGVRFRLGDVFGAYGPMFAFVQSRPDAPEAPEVRHQLRRLTSAIAARN